MKHVVTIGILMLVCCFSPVSSVYAAYPYSMTYTPQADDTILSDHINTSNNEHINHNIPESIDDYSNTVNEMGTTTDPYPADSESQATTLDGELQRLRHAIDQLKKKFNTAATKWYHDATDEGVLWVKGADVASATALPLLADGARVDVTGTTTIATMNTVGVGTIKCLQFDGALTLTDSASDLVLPSGDITTVAGDRAVFHEYATGDWELLSYSRTTGASVLDDESPQLGGDLDLNSKNFDFPTTANISDCLDEDTMSSDSATMIATQQSIKAYVDTASTGITLGTEKSTESITWSVLYSSIPSGTKRITIMPEGVSVNTTEEIEVHLGDSGGLEGSGYVSTASDGTTVANSTAGFLITASGGASDLVSGQIVLTRKNASHTWISSSIVKSGTGVIEVGAGNKTLTGELTQLELEPTGGAWFDLGTVNITYE